MEGGRRSLAENPVVVVIGVLAGLAGIIGLVVQLWPEGGGGSRGGGNGGQESPTTQPDALARCTDPSLSLSVGSGPSGTEVVVSGTGFPGDQSVDLRFHVEPLPPSRTDADGAFQVAVVIPGSLDSFAPSTFEINANTSPSVCFADVPFELTER